MLRRWRWWELWQSKWLGRWHHDNRNPFWYLTFSCKDLCCMQQVSKVFPLQRWSSWQRNLSNKCLELHLWQLYNTFGEQQNLHLLFLNNFFTFVHSYCFCLGRFNISFMTTRLEDAMPNITKWIFVEQYNSKM